MLSFDYYLSSTKGAVAVYFILLMAINESDSPEHYKSVMRSFFIRDDPSRYYFFLFLWDINFEILMLILNILVLEVSWILEKHSSRGTPPTDFQWCFISQNWFLFSFMAYCWTLFLYFIIVFKQYFACCLSLELLLHLYTIIDNWLNNAQFIFLNKIFPNFLTMLNGYWIFTLN